jgi:hypothetical protein
MEIRRWKNSIPTKNLEDFPPIFLDFHGNSSIFLPFTTLPLTPTTLQAHMNVADASPPEVSLKQNQSED